MNIPSLPGLEANLRHCLLLKGDDLYFTVAHPLGATLRNDFLGVQVEGLADENLSDGEIAAIDLDRFAITHRVRDIYRLLDGRLLSILHDHRPNSEEARNDVLDFVEHFLSTLPSVALGGSDLTPVKTGEVLQTYRLAYAWLNLIDVIEAAFYVGAEPSLTVDDLALLSGLDTRTVRNRCGPLKTIRTSDARTAQIRGMAAPAFVSVHPLDALDWLKGRQGFRIAKIDPTWMAARLATATGKQATKALIIASVVNLGTLASFAPAVGLQPEAVREWFDSGKQLPPETTLALKSKLGIDN